ncbi:MAG: glycosyltransferase [Lacipirellulaceae bacterium]
MASVESQTEDKIATSSGEGVRGPDPLRTIQIIESANAGVARHTLDLCEGLAERGCDVHLIYSPVRTDRLFEQGLARITAHPQVTSAECPIRRSVHPSDYVAANYVRRYAKKHGPFDVIHGHSSKAGAVGRLAAWRLKIPAIYTPHAIGTMNPLISRKARWLIGTIERQLSRVPGRLIALSPEEHHHLLGLGIKDCHIEVISNGIADTALPSKEEARNTLGLPADAPIVGFIGRLSKQKAVDVLVAGFAQVVSENVDARLAIIGTGELESQLREQAESLGVADRIDWLGHQDGFASMPAFDVFALPSRYEGLPYVLMEAVFAGLPIVASDLASSSLLLESGENGWVVPSEDPASLAEAITKLLANPEQRKAFGKASRLRAADFTIDKMVDKTLALYRQLAMQSR